MPINSCLFYEFKRRMFYPILWLDILNPNTNKSIKTFGIIDTGADECAIPAMYANALGHNLQAGKPKNISTGNGLTRAYTHTTKIDIYDPHTKKFLYELPDTPIDFMPNLNIVLLGVKSFLSKFVLTIDYPKKVFSIKFPITSNE